MSVYDNLKEKAEFRTLTQWDHAREISDAIQRMENKINDLENRVWSLEHPSAMYGGY